MKELWEKMQSHQENNKEEGGISFTYEEFSKLYSLVADTGWEHAKEVKLAMGKGALIGAVGVGLIGLGIKGISKLRKDNRSIENDNKKIEKLIEEVVESKKLSEGEKSAVDIKDLARELLDSYRKSL